jgi:hypothetical protein
MTKRAVLRGSTCLSGSLALFLATGCAMDAGEEMPLGDEPGMGEESPGQNDSTSADPASPDESGPDEGTATGEGEDQGTGDTGSAGEIENMTTVMGVNFENYGQGAVASPWSVGRSLASQATIDSSSGHGNVFHLQGSPATGDFLLARLSFSAPSDVAASVDVDPASDGSFVWSVNGTGVSTYKRRIRLQRWPGTTTLVASASPSGDTDCGSLPSNAWTKVTLVVHTATTPSTFDVLMNGQATSCTGLQAYVTKPFNMVEIMDSSNDGWGGDVRFDNIVVARP